jgi:hypothetical protein
MKSARIITALAAILAIPAMAADAPGYFQVPGTDTTLKLYGQIQLREGYGFNGNGMADQPDFLSGTTDDVQQSGQWSGSWRYYMGVTTTTPSALGDVTTKIYGRFNHSSGQPNGQLINFNLEQGYVSIGGLEVGTDWSLFGYGAWEPNTLFGCATDEDGSWENIRQIRYVFTPTKGLDLGISLESPLPAGTSNGSTPNIAAVAAYSADWGGVTLALLEQQYKDWTKDGVAATNRSGHGLGFFLSGGFNITKNDQLTAMILKAGEGYGEGFDGFYVDQSNTNDYTLYKSLGYNVSYTHTWNDQFSSAVTVGQIKWPKDSNVLEHAADDYKLTHFAVNTTWNMTKTVSLGVEYQNVSWKASNTKPLVDNNLVPQDSTSLDMIRLKLKATLF